MAEPRRCFNHSDCLDARRGNLAPTWAISNESSKGSRVEARAFENLSLGVAFWITIDNLNKLEIVSGIIWNSSCISESGSSIASSSDSVGDAVLLGRSPEAIELTAILLARDQAKKEVICFQTILKSLS